MITFLPQPIACITPEGDGWILYVKDNGMFENDEFTVALFKGGAIRHFTSKQISIWQNATYEIYRMDYGNCKTSELPNHPF